MRKSLLIYKKSQITHSAMSIQFNQIPLDWIVLTLDTEYPQFEWIDEDPLDWTEFSQDIYNDNPIYDYMQIYQNKQKLHEELIAKTCYINHMFIPEIAQMIARYMH